MKAQLITGELCEVRNTGEPALSYRGEWYEIFDDQTGDTYIMVDNTAIRCRLEYVNELLNFEKLDQDELSYTIKYDHHAKWWLLTLIEPKEHIPVKEDRIIGEYIYKKQDEAEQDILVLCKYNPQCYFTKIQS